MPLKSDVSCSSVHGSFKRLSFVGAGSGVSITIAFSSTSAAGVDAAFDFFFGGIVLGGTAFRAIVLLLSQSSPDFVTVLGAQGSIKSRPASWCSRKSIGASTSQKQRDIYHKMRRWNVEMRMKGMPSESRTFGFPHSV